MAFRDEMPPEIREEKSHQILQTLYDMQLYREAEMILTYVDYQSEVMTAPLLDRALRVGKQVFVPKVLGSDMEFYQIKDIGELSEGYRGIREPSGGLAFLDKMRDLDLANMKSRPLMLLPGAVFDKERHRIGYGKGFYDRYLMRLGAAGIRVHTLALCFECQMLNEIPYEAHDVRPEMILTEKRVYQ